MAGFSPQKFNLYDINDGQRFENGQVPEEIAFNAPIEGSAYAIEKADQAISISEEANAKADQAITLVGDSIIDKEFSPLTAYPIGSYYISENPTSPAVLFGGDWERVAAGRSLFGAGELNGVLYNAGTEINAGLPNIYGELYARVTNGNEIVVNSRSGAFTERWYDGTDTVSVVRDANTVYAGKIIEFNASNSNAIYGSSNTVQPNAVVAYMWKRVG